MSTPILEISGVHQAFRAGFWLKRVEVLQGVSFAVPARSIFGFLGANGAGKTTLIHLIAGLKSPASGRVELAGFPAASAEARARVGYLPERPYFHDHLTGEELLKYFGALSGMRRGRLLERIPAVLEAVGMREARRVELKRYSKGMLQRIGIAQAILHDPEFLVLDEPMSGLDPVGRKEMRDLILALAAEGRTVFFSSHVIPDVEAICDHVALIRKGKLVGSGPITGFLSQGAVRAEIGFAGVAPERARALPGMSAVRGTPDGFRGQAEGDASVDAAIRGVLAAGGRILWVTPNRPSLEELLTSKG